MKKLLIRIAAKWALPVLKEEVMKFVNSEELQIKYVKLLNTKLDIPNLSEEVERKLLDASYDAAQELIKENINKVDLEKIMENF